MACTRLIQKIILIQYLLIMHVGLYTKPPVTDFYCGNYGAKQTKLCDSAQHNDHNEREGRTLLHYAAQSGDRDWVALLIAQGFPIDAIDSLGSTPLHEAVRNGHYYIVKQLLEAQAPIYIFDCMGQSPFSYALMLGNQDMVALFLKYGADVNAHASVALSPLCICARQDDVVLGYYLLRYGGAAVNGVTKKGRSALFYARSENFIALLLNCGAFINLTDIRARNALHFAAIHHNHTLAYALLNAGLCAVLPDLDGNTACDYTYMNNDKSMMCLLKRFTYQSWF